MAFNPNMPQAQPGTTASSANYNGLISNILDLDTRATAAQSTANTANSTANGAVSVNNTQNTRLTTLETNQGTRGTNGAIYTEINSLKANQTATQGFGSFLQATGQSINHQAMYTGSQTGAADNRLVWDSVEGTPINVTRSSGNRVITINKAGLWLVSVFARFEGAWNTGRIVLWLGPPTTGAADRAGFAMIAPSAALTQPGTSFALPKLFTAGQQFSVYLYQDSGAAQTTLTQYNSTALSLVYLGG